MSFLGLYVVTPRAVGRDTVLPDFGTVGVTLCQIQAFSVPAERKYCTGGTATDMHGRSSAKQFGALLRFVPVCQRRVPPSLRKPREHIDVVGGELLNFWCFNTLKVGVLHGVGVLNGCDQAAASLRVS